MPAPTQNFYGIPMADPADILVSATPAATALNASNTAIASFFLYETGHGAITGLLYRVSAITSPPVYRLSLQGIASRNTPDGTVKGSGTAKVDLTPTVTTAIATLDSAYTGTLGEELAAVAIYQSGTIGASNTASFTSRANTLGSAGSPYSAIETTGTWAVTTAGPPSLAPVYADGYIGRNFCACASLLNNQPTSSSNPKFYGSLFTPSMNLTLSGALVGVRPAAGSSFVVSLYEGSNTTPVSVSATFNPDNLSSSASGVVPLYVPMPSYTLVAGTTYRLVVSMTTANVFTSFISASFINQAALNSFWGFIYGTTGSSGTLTWTDYASGTDWRAYPVIPCVDTLIGSGGGLLMQRGMTGGVPA